MRARSKRAMHRPPSWSGRSGSSLRKKAAKSTSLVASSSANDSQLTRTTDSLGMSTTKSWAESVMINGAIHQNGGTVNSSNSKPAPAPPSTWIGVAAFHLSQEGDVVYLLPVEYVQNWLNWAYEMDATAREQLRLAAVLLGLYPPTTSAGWQTAPANTEPSAASYHDPGPIDATLLSVEGHPLVLSPLVRLHSIDDQAADALSPFSLSRVTSANGRHLAPAPAPSSDKASITTLPAVAVPEPFYEMVRASHGVLCEDGRSVTFQPPGLEHRSPFVLHHHVFGEDGDVSLDESQSPPFQRSNSLPLPRPVEFRRKRIVVSSASSSPVDGVSSHRSLMEKLLAEEPRSVVEVEVHPLKVTYSIVDQEGIGAGRGSPHGYCLISRRAPAAAALKALLRVAAPNQATPQVRLWLKHEYPRSPTVNNPFEYEVVPNVDEPTGTLEDYLSSPQCEALVEVRRSANADWPLHRHELGARLQVGDFCDAQDVAGKWYEAVVVEVKDGTGRDPNDPAGDNKERGNIKVHYMGWASKWNTSLPASQPPYPLWSRTSRWRKSIRVGTVVEVRDSSSIVERPKWYKGVVRRIGRSSDRPRELVGGAQLEMHQGKHLLLLDQTRQVLVEVEQEKNSVTPALIKKASSTLTEDNGIEPQPPYLRWVYLYGEEICKLGTHLKEDSSAPATLRYEYDASRKPVEVLKGHGAGFMRESLRGTPPAPGSVGLQNLGNSCYMNGIVQCLNHIEPLTQYFLRDKYIAELNRSNPLGSGGNVTMAYASLLRKMWNGDYCILAPRYLKQTVASFAPQFDNSYQHDSHEFCQFLMDGLHEDLNRVKTKPYVEELEGFGMEDEKAAIESWRKHLLRHDSIIVDHCQGMHRSHLTCPRCGRESIKFDVFSSISLPLVTNKNQKRIELEDCLEKFMEGEQLDERNAWYCPSCRQHVCALKMIALWSVPDILILHLKRFTFDTCMTSGGMLRSKMDHTVEFPIEGLDLTKHILGPIDADAPPVYKLFGVSEHTGPTANSGHYTATVRNSIDGQWYRCNDSHVGHTSGEASITSDAYLLFYRRAKGISRWGGMEKAMREKNIDPYGGLLTDQEGFTKVNKKKKKK